MADYLKKYTILSSEVEDIITSLEKIPEAKAETERLRKALLRAEDRQPSVYYYDTKKRIEPKEYTLF